MSKSDYKSPEEMYGDLFYDIHRSDIFKDGKMFADANAKLHPDIILKVYKEEKDTADFNLKNFIAKYFDLPNTRNVEINSNSLEDHIHGLWDHLTRPADKVKKNRGSKIPLPHPYVVPGGRFDEIYYWDSYFTMLGLKTSGKIDLIESMVDNFKYLVDEFGHIPNGNRSYFLSRSQPPFFSLMVKLLIKEKGAEIIPKYLPALVKEYNWWMNGLTNELPEGKAKNRVIKLENKVLLNRYYDEVNTPREEMFRDDWELINLGDQLENDLFKNLRAACESGWDFSSRWLKDPQDLNSIETTSLLPVDLNCLLWHLEKLISECLIKVGNEELGMNYGILAHNRKKAINTIFWDDKISFFTDYNWIEKKVTSRLSLAGIFPMFFKLCSEEQAELCTQKITTTFLKKGGVVTTPYLTNQQWDAPNGWAPLQWIVVKGLLNYNKKELAQEIAHRWTKLNKEVFERTGKMLEKYNVEDLSLEGGGGEYPVQDGFGWTNGVYLAMTEGSKKA